MNITPMEYVRAALINAHFEGMTLQDVIAMAEHARTAQAFDEAVNVLAQTIKH